MKFVFMIFLAKFLGFSEVGFFGLVSAATIMFPVFLGCGLMYTIGREAVTGSLEKVTASIRSYIVFICIVYIILLFSFKLIESLFYEFHDNIDDYGFYIILVIWLEHINADIYNLLLNKTKIILANILHFIRTALWMGLFMVLSWFSPDFCSMEHLFEFWFMGSVLSAGAFLIYARRWPWFSAKREERFVSWFKKESSLARPAYINSMFVSVGQYISQFVISYFLGLEMNGVFVYYMQMVSALQNLLLTGSIQTYRPKMVQAFREKSLEFKRYYYTCRRESNIIALLTCVVSYPSAYFITGFLGRSLAIEWFPVFIFMLVNFIVMCNIEIGRMVAYSSHADKLLLKLSVIGTVKAVLLNVVLIYVFGMWGAIISMLAGGITDYLIQFYYVQKILGLGKR